MKKKWIKRAVGIGLAFAVSVGLCACGNNSGDANDALAKEGVYKLEEFKMPEIEADDVSVLSSAHKDGVVYLVLQLYNWSNYSEGDVRLLTMRDDGTDLQLVSMEMPGQQTNNDGANYDPNVWEYSGYGNYVFSPDGGIYAIKNYYYENYETEEYIRENYICNWGMDGGYRWEVPLEGLQSEEEWIYVSSITVTEDGTVNILLGGDNVYKMTVDSQGNASGKIPFSEETAAVFNSYDRIIANDDGTLLVIYYDGDDWSKELVATYDPVKDTLSEPSQFPSSITWGGFSNLSTGLNSDLIYTTGSGVYTYNIGDENSIQKMNFINSDLYITNMASLVELSDTSFLGIFFENYDQELKAGIFTYVDPKDIPDKSVLVLAGSYVGSDLKQRVVEYNRSSDKYKIVVKEYDSYNTYDDYQASYTQLNNDIITGKMPDILVTYGLPIENYASKGLLADIGKLIEEDAELSQVEFVENVFDSYSIDGKLYYIIPSFGVRTMIGKTSLVGDRTSWTMEEAQQLVSSLGEDATLFGETTRDNFFSIMMQYCGSDFVDVSTGKCDFNSPNFLKMMEYAKSLPTEINWEDYWDNYWENYQSRYRENRAVLMTQNIYSFSGLNYYINGMFGEDVSYIGFPTASGQGSYINSLECYAISSKSANLEGAWEFMRYYLTDEYQSDLGYGLSVYKKYFLENAQKALEKPFYLDEDGNKVEYDDYFYLNDEQILLEPLTQEQVDKIVDFVLSVNKCYYSNDEIINIINEEMEAYFSGQKSAEEVAKVIQSRAQVYVDENR